ncbi:DUF4386 domain-containing protein [Nocardiopsis sp. YSL2]|uniref:DUF4386 domain-containing protein n=1 Tax=Nocardiopsis sp. YSL2 TaxID=2939492 RepID=UPI0026F41743|nr:DUF4386 domain-containing protein [Nocardiopsis sp. YSL2]
MAPSVRTARLTGLAYLGLALTAVIGSLVLRPGLYVAGDPSATLANLLAHQATARGVVALEIGVSLTQALVAVLFYRLFRSVDGFAAGAVAAFGLVNATMILVSAGLLGTANAVAFDAAGGAAATVQLMYVMSEHMWAVAALFFGLWLLPMGWLAHRSRWMPRPLGWFVMAGGAGYVLNSFAGHLAPDATAVTNVLLVPAAIGELWMIAYLLVRGVRPGTAPPERVDMASPTPENRSHKP